MSLYFTSLHLFPEQPQQMDEAMRIPKETIDILKDQVFGFDTFFVTSQEPYEVSRLLEWLSMSCCLQFPCIKYYM